MSENTSRYKELKMINARDLFYPHTCICDNCGHENKYQIRKGTLVHDFLRRATCEHCECNILKAARSVWGK